MLIGVTVKNLRWQLDTDSLGINNINWDNSQTLYLEMQTV